MLLVSEPDKKDKNETKAESKSKMQVAFLYDSNKPEKLLKSGPNKRISHHGQP